ncbi:hypothetical protein GCM10023107_01040 [Actinoplanes octamycinicus]|nr:hypothetical protein Aoc01nite_92120 [Actinoplanes octamycinicus]
MATVVPAPPSLKPRAIPVSTSGTQPPRIHSEMNCQIVCPGRDAAGSVHRGEPAGTAEGGAELGAAAGREGAAAGEGAGVRRMPDRAL